MEFLGSDPVVAWSASTPPYPLWPDDAVVAIAVSINKLNKAARVAKTMCKLENVTKSTLQLGQKIHKAYRADEVFDGVKIKEFRLPSGNRIDFLDIEKGIIYELKPNNPRAILEGQKQLQMYMQELQTIPRFQGIQWKTVLDRY